MVDVVGVVATGVDVVAVAATVFWHARRILQLFSPQSAVLCSFTCLTWRTVQKCPRLPFAHGKGRRASLVVTKGTVTKGMITKGGLASIVYQCAFQQQQQLMMMLLCLSVRACVRACVRMHACMLGLYTTAVCLQG